MKLIEDQMKENEERAKLQKEEEERENKEIRDKEDQDRQVKIKPVFTDII